MNKFATFACAALLATAGVSATAESHATGSGDVVQDRQASMKAIGGAMRTIGGMAQGKVDFDAAAAQAALDSVAMEAAMLPDLFMENVTEGSKAQPAIWENWEDFVAKAEMLKAAAEAGDATSAETLGASMGGLGGACSACHKDYRVSNS